MSSSLTYEVHRYGKDHELQRVGVWRSPDAKPQSSNPWIIYIHGGAWRDFRIDHTTFRPTIDALLKQGGGGHDGWAGFASVDYRLSPHPSFPQDPASTPAHELRAAAHPDHIRDVRAALGYLQARYGFGSDYVLLGHSAGATLALQLLMGTGADGADDDDVALPRAVLGLEGIYDLIGLADRLGPAYAELFRGAFPGGREAWAEVSPLRFAGDFAECWGKGGGKSEEKLVVLGWGPQDELIDEPEIDGMAKRLGEDGVHVVVVKDLEGTHDGMWEDGRPFARVVLQALAELRK